MRTALRGNTVRATPRYARGPRINSGAGGPRLDGMTIPPPVKGWDASSSRENMDPASAIILDNWFPEPAYVRLRGGHSQHATTVDEGNDTYAKIMLHFNGADAATTITDSNAGGAAHTWTASGNAQLDTAQSVFGGSSLLCDGTADRVTTPDHANFTLAASDFTIDVRVRPAADGALLYVGGQLDAAGAANANSAWYISRTAANKIEFGVVKSTTPTTVTSTTSVIAGAWYHVAAVRTGNVLKLFINGTQEGGSIAFTGSVNDSSAVLGVGRAGAVTTTEWNGWVDEFRLSVGIARWTAAFTVPTVEYETVDTAGAIESLMPYHGPSGTEKLFAARGTIVYEVTSTGAEGVTGLTNARWQDINYTTGGSTYLYIVNGADSPRHYNGTTWATPAITGITASQAIHINAHKHRIWFILVNSTKAAYLPTDAIAGAATEFDLGPHMTMGGYLMAMGTWTLDNGVGQDDHAVFVTSKGQVIVYAGNNPADANDWVHKGTYQIGPPIGRRCLMNVGPDIAVITIDGVVSMSLAIQQDRTVVNKAAITAKIQRAINDAMRNYGTNYGFQFITYPKGTYALLNVPLSEGRLAHQYVMNTLTGAWCRFKGQNAICWAIFKDRIFFGGTAGVVYEADKTGRDNGELIVADMKTAFNHLGQRGVNKNFSMIRALMYADGTAIPSLTINTDYRDFAPSTVASPYTATGAVWGSFNWGDGTLWAGGNITLADWISVNDVGYCAAVRMKIAPQNSNATAIPTLQINGFDIKWERASGSL